VRQFWEERLDGRITWYISSLGQLENFFEERARAIVEQSQTDAREPQLTGSEA
jgi:hypothetical protein